MSKNVVVAGCGEAQLFISNPMANKNLCAALAAYFLCTDLRSRVEEDYFLCSRAGHLSALLTFFLWVPVCIKKRA
jgi:hypothetical protein